MAVRSEEAEELEGELKELEEDFAAGELTEKGYEKRKKVIILKKELLEGDITEKGYYKKMNELLTKPATGKSAELERKTPTSSSAITAAKSLINAPSVKSELTRLFGTCRSASQGGSQLFNPSALEQPVTKKRRRSAGGSAVTSKKRSVTAVCLKEATAFVPRRAAREKLAQAGRIKSISISHSMTIEEIEAVLLSDFATCCSDAKMNITFFKGDRGNGLAQSSKPETGDDVFTLIGHGCLYFTATPTFAEQQHQELSAPVVSHPPKQADKSEENPVQESLANGESLGPWTPELENQLLDPTIGLLWLEEAGLCPRKDDDPDEDLYQNQSRQNGEFLLYAKNLEVQRWIAGRKERGFEMRMSGAFVIVDEDSFADFDEQRIMYRKQNPSSVAIPPCTLLLRWMAETGCAVREIKEHGHAYFVLSHDEFDELAWWTYQHNEHSFGV